MNGSCESFGYPRGNAVEVEGVVSLEWKLTCTTSQTNIKKHVPFSSMAWSGGWIQVALMLDSQM
jgi:hypothetical protein